MSRIGQEITNSADILDSRDIIRRIEELESDRAPYVDAIDEAEEAITEAEEALRQADEGVNTSELQEAVCKAVEAREKALDALDEFDDTAEGEELATLKAVAEEGENYADDWNHGVALIRDSYFRTHAEELADDLGLVPSDAPWPLTCIDWRRAAEELKADYTAIEFDGVTYWVR